MTGLKMALGLVLTLLFSLSGQALLRFGVTRQMSTSHLDADSLFRHNLLTLLLSPAVIAGFLASGVGAVCWLYVLAHYELGRALPLLSGLAYLALFGIGRVVLKEQTSWIHLLGIAAVILGAYLLSYKPG